MGKNQKMEAYVRERLAKLSDERVIIIVKLNKIKMEINELEKKINEIEDNVDTAYEIFSPRPKMNDFSRNELVTLTLRKKDLTNICSDYEEQVLKMDEEIGVIEGTLSDTASSVALQIKNDEKNKVYGANILELQEQERQRIASDLHDSVVQTITNLIYKAEICAKSIDVDTVKAKLELEIMSKSLRGIVSEMRNIIYGLYPININDINEDVVFESIISKIKVNSPIDIYADIKGVYDGSVPKIIVLSLIRVIQEATNNANKHSKAKNIYINIKKKKAFIEVSIEDDGIGFDVNDIFKRINKEKKFGLSMMKERVELLSGELKILSDENSGTHLFVKIPI